MVEGAGPVVISGNILSGIRSGGVRGMRWKDYVSGDLTADASSYSHITVTENRVG